MSKKNNNNKDKVNESAFDLEAEINKLTVPNMFKEGLKYYIKSNNLTVKNIKELEKIVKEYGELKL
ncbi:hypothetical protein [Methanobrevibacter sp.]